MKYKSILWALGSMLFSACAVEDVANSSTVDENGMQTITVESASFDEPATRVNAVVKPAGGYTFPWQDGDQIAVHGSSSEAKGWGFFTLAGGEGNSSGNFKSIFKLQQGVEYYSFYPALDFTSGTNAKSVLVDYTGQKQTSDADLSHLSNYIYMAAKGDDSYNFKSKHVGSLVKIQLQDPKYATANKIVISTDEEDFILKGTVDLTTATATVAPDITATQKSSTFEIDYSVGGATVTDNTITVYAMIAPTDLSGKELKATVKHIYGADTEFTLESDPANPFVKGKAYVLTGTLIDQTKEYLTFTAQEDNSTISFMDGRGLTIEYSFDKVNWTVWDYSAITLSKNQKVYLRGDNPKGTVLSGDVSVNTNNRRFIMTGTIAASGNVMSLLSLTDFDNILSAPRGCFAYLFSYCTSLTTAPVLPATTLDYGCYQEMFRGCSNLVTAPDLPATILDEVCYSGMFQSCKKLTKAPELPAQELAESCYKNMFYSCASLNSVKAAFTTTPGSDYTNTWLLGVSTTGTFYKNKNATWDIIGSSGIPSGWTVIEYEP